MSARICRICHKKSARSLCKTCERTKYHHDRVYEAMIDEMRREGWVEPEVKTIRKVKASK